jgi:hypothetical protein
MWEQKKGEAQNVFEKKIVHDKINFKGSFHAPTRIPSHNIIICKENLHGIIIVFISSSPKT